MKHRSSFYADLAVLLFYVVLLLTALVGWVKNIIAIINTDVINGMLVGRVVGVFIAPVGSVLGFL